MLTRVVGKVLMLLMLPPDASVWWLPITSLYLTVFFPMSLLCLAALYPLGPGCGEMDRDESPDKGLPLFQILKGFTDKLVSESVTLGSCIAWECLSKLLGKLTDWSTKSPLSFWRALCQLTPCLAEKFDSEPLAL